MLEQMPEKLQTFFHSSPYCADNLLLLALGGSHLYGTATPESDLDIRGVFMDTERMLLGFDKKETIVCSEPADISLYSFRKFIQLGLKSNPSVLEILYAPKEKILFTSDVGQELIQNRDLFLSQKVYWALNGAIQSDTKRVRMQEKELNGLDRSIAFADSKEEVELYEEMQKNVRKKMCKTIMQMTRLCYTCQETLETNAYVADMSHHATILQQIRKNYEYATEHLKVQFPQMIEKMEERRQKSKLKEEVNIERVERLQIRLLIELLEGKND